MISTWRELLTKELERNKEDWDDVVAIAIRESDSLDTPFYTGYGGTEGCPFTVWSVNYVYFPKEYDGAESVCSVSRHPNGKPTAHI